MSRFYPKLLVFGLLAAFVAGIVACAGLLVRDWCQNGRNLTPLHIRILEDKGVAAQKQARVLARTPWGGLDEIQQTGPTTWAVKSPRLRYITQVFLEAESADALAAIRAIQYTYDKRRDDWRSLPISNLHPTDSQPDQYSIRVKLTLMSLRKTVLPPYRGTLNWRGDLNLFGRALGAATLILVTLVTPVIILACVIGKCVRDVRTDRVKVTRRYRVICGLIIIFAAAIMVLNTFTHPPGQSYDAKRQEAAVRVNEDLYRFAPEPLPYQFEYHPVFYYYVMGKANHFFEKVLNREINPYYLMRLVHAALMSSVLLGYAFIFSPRLLRNETAGLVGLAMMVVIPNVYLTQVMVRPGHFLLFAVHFMFIAWFAFDFQHRLGRDWRATLIWAGLLIAMANSQHLAFPAFALFFGWGAWVLFKDYQHERRPFKLARGLLLCGFITLLSGQHYGLRYARTGHITEIRHDLPYFAKYYERQKDFNRIPMFTNFQFDKLLAQPNRFASFRNSNAFLPRLYGDMWGDHWLYFSGPEPHRENEAWIKRLVFVLALPFAVIYLGAPLLSILRRPVTNWREPAKIAAFLFLASILLLVFLVYRVPEPGKNSLVKFCYIMGYYWFPAVCTGNLFDRHPGKARIFLAYIAALGLASMPLYLYLW